MLLQKTLYSNFQVILVFFTFFYLKFYLNKCKSDLENEVWKRFISNLGELKHLLAAMIFVDFPRYLWNRFPSHCRFVRYF